MENIRLVITGKAATGKDTLRKSLKIPFMPMLTTRPRRLGEQDGRDYRFVSGDEFTEACEAGRMLVYSTYNKSWNYGVLREDWEQGGLFIMPPALIIQLGAERSRCTVILLESSVHLRTTRLTERADANDTVERRVSNDEETFGSFSDYDLVVRDWSPANGR